ncbi:hypothetical protein L4Z68_001280 [Pseudomonas aeruginosa]
MSKAKVGQLMNCPLAERVRLFLIEIGLPVAIAPGASGFVEHSEFYQGTLRVDPQCRASSLLHEAGHLAVIPGRYRHMVTGSLGQSIRAILADPIFETLPPDDPLMRAMIQTSDPEVTAWAWAAGTHLQIPPKMIIMDDEYSGEGKLLRMQLKAMAYIGINGLSHGGFCQRRANPYSSLPVYPALAFWLQP